jgi:hypothetical protein
MEVLERWNFNVEVNGENGLPMAENIPPAELVFFFAGYFYREKR